LSARGGIGDAMAALRRHGSGAAGSGLFTTVCAHGSWLPTRRAGQTTSSLVSHLASGTHFVTGTAAPCTSVFKPVWLNSGLAGYGPPPGQSYQSDSLWWRHERLHRRALADLDDFLARYAPERDRLEQELVDDALRAESAGERRAITERAFERAAAFEQAWLERLVERPLHGVVHALFWRRLDARSGIG
jgi:hypothetical protein